MNSPNVSGFFRQLVFMTSNIGRENARPLWGVYPICDFVKPNVYRSGFAAGTSG